MKYENPYPIVGDYDKNLHGRIHADVSKEDYMFIRGIVPNGGVQTTIGILWTRLITLCKTHGISNITDQQRYQDLVANIELIDGRTLDRVVRQTNAPNDSGGKTKKGGRNKVV